MFSIEALAQIKPTQPVWKANQSPPQVPGNNSNPVSLSQLVTGLIDIGRIKPYGNVEPPVGFVLENSLDTHSECSNDAIRIPVQFQDSGWNITNSLTWAAHPAKKDISGMTQRLKSEKTDIELFTLLNQAAIQQSGTRIILMSGHSLQEFVLPVGCKETLLKETLLTLDIMEVPMFVELENEASCVKRVYIQIPHPVDADIFRDWRKIHKISKVLNLTSAMTKTSGIRPYAGDSGCVLTKAIRDYVDEKTGVQEVFTLETLHPMARLWLARRGFVKDGDACSPQEKAGGSLSNAILVLLHVETPLHHLHNTPTTSSTSLFQKPEKCHTPRSRLIKRIWKRFGVFAIS